MANFRKNSMVLAISRSPSLHQVISRRTEWSPGARPFETARLFRNCPHPFFCTVYVPNQRWE